MFYYATTTRPIAFAIEGENKLLGIHQLSNHLAYPQPCLGCIVDANSLGRPAQRLVIHCPLHCWSEPFSGNADVRAIGISRRPLMRQRAAPRGLSFNPAVIDADAAPQFCLLRGPRLRRTSHFRRASRNFGLQVFGCLATFWQIFGVF
jgi:hypothetical protein